MILRGVDLRYECILQVASLALQAAFQPFQAPIDLGLETDSLEQNVDAGILIVANVAEITV